MDCRSLGLAITNVWTTYLSAAIPRFILTTY